MVQEREKGGEVEGKRETYALKAVTLENGGGQDRAATPTAQV